MKSIYGIYGMYLYPTKGYLYNALMNEHKPLDPLVPTA